MTEDERVAYLDGDLVEGLSAADRAELDDLRALLADESMWVEPSASLAERVVVAVSAAAGESAPVAPVIDLAARRSGRTRILMAGLIAAAVVAIGVPVGFILRPHHPAAQFGATLAGSALAPGAHGAVTLRKTTSGWRISLDASGLPRLDNGDYYEAWLKNADGTLVAVGTFNEPRGVTLWAGVPPTSFPKLTITRQTVGGGAASSGQVVLSGPITAR